MGEKCLSATRTERYCRKEMQRGKIERMRELSEERRVAANRKIERRRNMREWMKGPLYL
jgi:hypothetical protein